jgi:hypothetical protein
MSPPLTGLPAHEWLGLGLIAVVLVHLLGQWDWTIASSTRFVRRLSGRLRFTYLLNWALFLCLCTVMVSGVLISEAALPALGIGFRGTGGPGGAMPVWRLVHTLSANGLLVLAGIHVGLNWRWVLGAVGSLVGPSKPRRTTAAVQEVTL